MDHQNPYRPPQAEAHSPKTCDQWTNSKIIALFLAPSFGMITITTLGIFTQSIVITILGIFLSGVAAIFVGLHLANLFNQRADGTTTNFLMHLILWLLAQGATLFVITLAGIVFFLPKIG